MYATYLYEGKSIDFFPTTDIPAGSVIVQGNLIGITKVDLKAGCLGAVAVVGVYAVVKGAIAVPVGSKIYWDDTAKQAVLEASGNALLGVAVAEAAVDDATVKVRLAG